MKRRRQKAYRLGHLRVQRTELRAEPSRPEYAQSELVPPKPQPERAFKPLLVLFPVSLAILICVSVVAFIVVQTGRDIGSSSLRNAAELSYWLNWLSFASASTSLISSAVTPFLVTTETIGNKRILTSGGWISIAIAIGSFIVALSSEGIKQLHQARIDRDGRIEKQAARQAVDQDLKWKKRADDLTSQIYNKTSEQLDVSKKDIVETLHQFSVTREKIDFGANLANYNYDKFAQSISNLKLTYAIMYNCEDENVSDLCEFLEGDDNTIDSEEDGGDIYIFEGRRVHSAAYDKKRGEIGGIWENLINSGYMYLEICIDEKKEFVTYDSVNDSYTNCELHMSFSNPDLDDISIVYFGKDGDSAIYIIADRQSPGKQRSHGISSMMEIGSKYLGVQYKKGEGDILLDISNGVGFGFNTASWQCEHVEKLTFGRYEKDEHGERCVNSKNETEPTRSAD